MENFFQPLNDDITLIISFCIMSMYLAMVLLFYTIKKKERFNKNKTYQLISDGLNKDTIKNKNDLSLVFKSKVQKQLNISFCEFLESYLVHILENSDVEQTKKAKEIIEPIIAQEKVEKPYSNIKDRERRILLAIEKAASNNELNAIKDNLEDLSIVIANNQDNLDKAKKTNKWTVPISIVGVLLTAFFGFYSLRGSSISNKDIEKISNNITNTIIDSIQSNKNVLEIKENNTNNITNPK